MLTITEVIAYLKVKFPSAIFFNSMIDNSLPQCIGIYRRTAARIKAIGDNGSYDVLPLSIIVHWTEDAGLCEEMANLVYAQLGSIIKETLPSGAVIIYTKLQDTNPVWVGRDSKNIAENVIRANIIYERGA